MSERSRPKKIVQLFSQDRTLRVAPDGDDGSDFEMLGIPNAWILGTGGTCKIMCMFGKDDETSSANVQNEKKLQLQCFSANVNFCAWQHGFMW